MKISEESKLDEWKPLKFKTHKFTPKRANNKQSMVNSLHMFDETSDFTSPSKFQEDSSIEESKVNDSDHEESKHNDKSEENSLTPLAPELIEAQKWEITEIKEEATLERSASAIYSPS